MRKASFNLGDNEAVKNPWLEAVYILRILTYDKKKILFNRAHLCSLLLSSLKLLTQSCNKYFMGCS